MASLLSKTCVIAIDEVNELVRSTLLRLKLITNELIRSLTAKIRSAKRALTELSTTSHPDPKMEAELKRLQTALQRLQSYAQEVLAACRNLVYRTSNKEVIRRINLELKNSQVSELKKFLDQINDCLSNCHTRINNFNTCYQTLRKELEAAVQAQSVKENEKRKEIGRKDSGAVATGVVAVGSGVAAVGFGIATLATGGAAAVFAGIITGVATASAAASGGANIKLQESKGNSEKDLEQIKKAAEAILKMQKEMNNSCEKIQEMEACVQNASEAVNGLKSAEMAGLKDYVEKQVYNEDGTLTHHHTMSHELDELQEAMKELLKLIDDDSQ